jgi:hypothetical protein
VRLRQRIDRELVSVYSVVRSGRTSTSAIRLPGRGPKLTSWAVTRTRGGRSQWCASAGGRARPGDLIDHRGRARPQVDAALPSTFTRREGVLLCSCIRTSVSGATGRSVPALLGLFGRCPHHRTSTPTRKVDGLPRNRLGIRDAGSLESGWKADCLGLGEVRIEAAAEGGGIHVLRLAVALTTPLQLL